MTVCVSEFPCKYSFQERALVAFKLRPIVFIMNKICLNQTSKLIDFDTMLEMLREGVGNKTVTTTRPHAIVREGQVGLGGMYTRSQEKTYRMVYDKRRILPDGVSTVPLGWLDGDDVTAGDI